MLIQELRAALALLRNEPEQNRIFFAYNESHIVAYLTFDELLQRARFIVEHGPGSSRQDTD